MLLRSLLSACGCLPACLAGAAVPAPVVHGGAGMIARDADGNFATSSRTDGMCCGRVGRDGTTRVALLAE